MLRDDDATQKLLKFSTYRCW